MSVSVERWVDFLVCRRIYRVVSVVVDPVVKEVPSKVVGIGSWELPLSRETEASCSFLGVLAHCPLGWMVVRAEEYYAMVCSLSSYDGGTVSVPRASE